MSGVQGFGVEPDTLRGGLIPMAATHRHTVAGTGDDGQAAAHVSGESVLVCFHAHPDDEVFSTGGVMRLAVDAGHRVVLVTATDGALGEVPEGLLDVDERLVDRRRRELAASARALGVHRLETMDYPDSGMAGTAENARSEAFCNVDVELAVQRLAGVLAEEGADVLTIYDPNANYGHPDHVQVHRVGVRAAELAGVAHVYEAAVNRDRMAALFDSNPNWTDQASTPDLTTIGLPASEITTIVDVRAVMAAKRAAMQAHESQVGDFGPFLAMSDEEVAAAFGEESFRRRGPVQRPRTWRPRSRYSSPWGAAIRCQATRIGWSP